MMKISILYIYTYTEVNLYILRQKCIAEQSKAIKKILVFPVACQIKIG